MRSRIMVFPRWVLCNKLFIASSSLMSQLQISDCSRAEQGRRKLKDSVRLYGRDDVWNSLSAQLQVWDRIRAGWRPHSPIQRRPASSSGLAS